MQQNSSTGSRTARDLAVLVALTVLLHAPFVGQAFHLDDVQYLDVAMNVPHNPLFPMDLPSVFEGRHLTLWGHTHPPLNAYLIAGRLKPTPTKSVQAADAGFAYAAANGA